MSIERRPEPRMPHPEQWMSDHPIVAGLLALLVFALAYGGLTALVG